MDAWRRLKAFHAAGVKLQLICWCGDRPDEMPTQEHLAEVRKFTESVTVFPIRRTFSARLLRLLRLTHLPSHVASRMLLRPMLRKVLDSAAAFNMDAVWLDGIYGGELARGIARECRVPFFVRSQNIEHVYMKRQAQLAQELRDRVAWTLAAFHLRNYETRLLGESRLFFDISVDDLQFWTAQGLSNGHWLPSQVDAEFASSLCRKGDPKDYDVVYLGNLNTPNNVQGLEWFANEVLPRLKAKRADIRVVIAGSRPSDSIKALCALHPENLVLISNPPDAADVYRRGRVLINPILHGSGVNIKSVEMLQTDSPIVTTPQGVKGLPEDVKACFQVESSPEGFADRVLDGLRKPQIQDVARGKAQALFQFEGIETVLKEMRNCLVSKHTKIEVVAS